MQQMMSSRNAGGYEAGKRNRLAGKFAAGSSHENDQPRAQIETMGWRSWNLYRNNPQARKIIRTLCAKVVGRGLSPQPQTVTKEGKPFVEFRQRARLIWDEWSRESDFRGKPGRGGHNFVSQCKTALRSIVLSGGVLYRFHHLDAKNQKRQQLFIPLQIQLLHVDRLDRTRHGNSTFYGAELDSEGKTIAYHVLKGGTQQAASLQTTVQDTERIEAKDMGHLFMEEDIDQILGTPWFGAALLTMDDRRNYEASELTAAEMGSCFVAGYRRSRGKTGGIGLPNPDSTLDLTDADGNAISRIQPGMFLDLGTDGAFESINPNRPNSGAEAFINHLVRSEAVSMPGVKSSTVTGDYRNSSFSSERSADNDVWPELEELQDFFSGGFCQPIYEEVIITAFNAGKFDDIKGWNATDFNERRREYLKTNWQGPVPRSINPVDDADAARERVKNANSSPQREAAQLGRDWRQIIEEIEEFITYCKERKVPDDIWQQALGIEQKDPDAAAAKDTVKAMQRSKNGTSNHSPEELRAEVRLRMD
jgi:lambda family phage portal protein